MYECLIGYPPFCSESTHDTYQKIMQWQDYLVFPDDVYLSIEAEDLMRRYVSRCKRFFWDQTYLTLALQTDHCSRAKVGCGSYQESPFFLWG